MLAHVAGAPIEETALSLAPMALAAAGMASARLRGIAAGRKPARFTRGGRRFRFKGQR